MAVDRRRHDTGMLPVAKWGDLGYGQAVRITRSGMDGGNGIATAMVLTPEVGVHRHQIPIDKRYEHSTGGAFRHALHDQVPNGIERIVVGGVERLGEAMLAVEIFGRGKHEHPSLRSERGAHHLHEVAVANTP